MYLAISFIGFSSTLQFSGFFFYGAGDKISWKLSNQVGPNW